jgi:hypothetical protein
VAAKKARRVSQALALPSDTAKPGNDTAEKGHPLAGLADLSNAVPVGYGKCCPKCGGLTLRLRSPYDWQTRFILEVDICPPCFKIDIRVVNKFDA